MSLFSSSTHQLNLTLLYCLVHLHMVHHALTALIVSSSERASVKLGHFFNSFLCPLPTFFPCPLLPCFISFLCRLPLVQSQHVHLRRQLTVKRPRPAQMRKQERRGSELSHPPQRQSHLPTQKRPIRNRQSCHLVKPHLNVSAA